MPHLFVFRRRLKADIALLGLHPTDTQKAAIQRQQNSLQRKIEAWRRVQALYTPAVQLLHAYSFQSSSPVKDLQLS
jgi:hypothetical protein